MFFCGVFASTRNYLQLRIQSARREHDIEIGGVGSRGSHQPARPVNLRLTQRRLLRSISGQYQPVFGGEALPLGFVVLKNHEWNRLARPQEVKHIAAVNFFFGAQILGEKPQVELANLEMGPAGLKTKAEIVQYLKDSFAYARRAIQSITAQNGSRAVKNPFGQGPDFTPIG